MPIIPNGVKIKDLADRAKNAYNAITGKDYSPGLPIQPTTSEQSQLEGARQFQYPINFNIITKPRSEFGDLTPYDYLYNLATSYDVAALCIATRIEETQGLGWSIVTRDKSQQWNKQEDCKKVVEFFRYPDKEHTFSDWLALLLYDLFVFDALTLYKVPNKLGGLYALQPIDGSTVKVLLNDRGVVAGYQQYLYSIPFAQYQTENKDTDGELPIYNPNELIYRPRWLRNRIPYGFPPTEWVILRVNTALRKQTFDLNYFTEGNIPDLLISPPDDMLNPQQVANYERYFNSMLSGKDAERRKAKFLPFKADIKELRPFNYDTKLDEWMLKITCAAYGVPPSEIGFTDDINKATSSGQENIAYRRGLVPLAKWLKQLFDKIIQVDLGFPDLEFSWQFGETEDNLVQAQTDQIYFNIGAITAKELRVLRFSDIVEGQVENLTNSSENDIVQEEAPKSNDPYNVSDNFDYTDIENDIEKKYVKVTGGKVVDNSTELAANATSQAHITAHHQVVVANRAIQDAIFSAHDAAIASHRAAQEANFAAAQANTELQAKTQDALIAQHEAQLAANMANQKPSQQAKTQAAITRLEARRKTQAAALQKRLAIAATRHAQQLQAIAMSDATKALILAKRGQMQGLVDSQFTASMAKLVERAAKLSADNGRFVAAPPKVIKPKKAKAVGVGRGGRHRGGQVGNQNAAKKHTKH